MDNTDLAGRLAECFYRTEPRLLNELLRRGAVHLDVVESASDLLDVAGNPMAACFFQLPQPVGIEPGWNSFSWGDQGRVARINARVVKLSINEVGSADFSEWGGGGLADWGETLVTQFAMLLPLREFHADFFQRYEFHMAAGRSDEYPLRKGFRTATRKSAPIYARDYETSLCSVMTKDALEFLRHLVPAYDLLAMAEIVQPRWLFNFFVVSTPGRAFYNRLPSSIVQAAVRPQSLPPEFDMFAADLSRLMRGAIREIMPIERQVLALHRVLSGGEPSLVLLGCVSVMEYAVASRLGIRRSDGKQMSLSVALRKNILGFVDDELRVKLLAAIDARNIRVHGVPPSRNPVTDPSIDWAGRENETVLLEMSNAPNFDAKELLRLTLHFCRLVEDFARKSR